MIIWRSSLTAPNFSVQRGYLSLELVPKNEKNKNTSTPFLEVLMFQQSNFFRIIFTHKGIQRSAWYRWGETLTKRMYGWYLLINSVGSIPCRRHASKLRGLLISSVDSCKLSKLIKFALFGSFPILFFPLMCAYYQVELRRGRKGVIQLYGLRLCIRFSCDKMEEWPKYILVTDNTFTVFWGRNTVGLDSNAPSYEQASKLINFPLNKMIKFLLYSNMMYTSLYLPYLSTGWICTILWCICCNNVFFSSW